MTTTSLSIALIVHFALFGGAVIGLALVGVTRPPPLHSETRAARGIRFYGGSGNHVGPGD